MFETSSVRETFVLAAVESERGENAEESLSELALLVDTCGGFVSGQIIQRRERIHPGHYLGKGKLDELLEMVIQTKADGIVTDDELTSAQQKKLHDILGVKILDRTMVILDIFANRAVSAEGKTQVELAQLKYRLSHLSGIGAQLSRQAGGGGIAGGGIGTRGPGETKLETDRRHIRSRIDQLNHELKDLLDNRAVLRKSRNKSDVPIIALVGYTNAGKSTLMNALTSAGVFVENKLFATLDTTTRKMILPGGAQALVSDTVGFISKLPHHLIQAFKATLEELNFADILLHVVDGKNPARAEQMRTTYNTLVSLGCMDKPIVTVINKSDLFDGDSGLCAVKDENATVCIPISALSGDNLPSLLNELEDIIKSMRKKITVLLPYSEGVWVNILHSKAEIVSEEHTETGTLITAYTNAETAGQLEKFVS